MIKKIFRYILWFCILPGFLHSCKEQPNLKIGFCMDSFVSERWEKDRDYFVEKIKELGGEVIVEAAQGDDKKQFDQATKMFDMGISVLVIVAVNRESAGDIVEAAHKRGIKVMAYDRLIRRSNLDYYISFDNIKVGELQADYLTKRKPTGNYVIISGPPMDNNSFLYKLGQMNILQPLIEKGDIKIVYDNFTDDWTEDEGAKNMEKALLENKNQVDAVLAANDILANGVIKVLEKFGLTGKIIVSGQDAELKACRNIIAGAQTMTVYKPIKEIATSAAEAAIRLAKNEPLTNANLRVNNGKKMVPAILLPSMVVNKDNIKLTVVSDGYHDEKDLY